MSNSALDRTTFEAIEAYVLDRMSADERSAFERRMAADAALRAEVELEQENIRAVELGGITRMLKDIAASERVTEETGSSWSRYLKVAAVVGVLVAGAMWWVMRPTTNEQLFAVYYTPDPGLPVTMGATDDPAFADAMVAYKLGNFEEARSKWSPLEMAEPTNDTLIYFIASASLSMDDMSHAIPRFEALVNDPSSAFNNKSKWYLFLAYIKKGEMEKANALSLDDDPTYGERVRAIKAQLK